MDLPGVAEVRRIDLRPGDRLVITLAHELDDQEFDKLRQDVRAAFGEAIPVVVLSPGMDLTVIGPENGGALWGRCSA